MIEARKNYKHSTKWQTKYRISYSKGKRALHSTSDRENHVIKRPTWPQGPTVSSEAVCGERGTCQKEIRDRAEHVPPTSLHHTTDRWWVMPTGFERATKHFRAERFYIVIIKFGLPLPRTLFIYCVSIFGRVAGDVSYCCSSEYCVDNVAQWYRICLEPRARLA